MYFTLKAYCINIVCILGGSWVIWVSSFLYEYPVVSVPFVEKTFLSPLHCFGTFVKSQTNIGLCPRRCDWHQSSQSCKTLGTWTSPGKGWFPCWSRGGTGSSALCEGRQGRCIHDSFHWPPGVSPGCRPGRAQRQGLVVSLNWRVRGEGRCRQLECPRQNAEEGRGALRDAEGPEVGLHWPGRGQPASSVQVGFGFVFPGGCAALPSSTGLLELVPPVRSVVLGFPWCPSSTCPIKPQRSALGWGALSPRLLWLPTPC